MKNFEKMCIKKWQRLNVFIFQPLGMTLLTEMEVEVLEIH